MGNLLRKEYEEAGVDELVAIIDMYAMPSVLGGTIFLGWVAMVLAV